MKLRFKTLAVIFTLLAFTWLMPPNHIIDPIVAYAVGVNEEGASSSETADTSADRTPEQEKAIAAAAKRANSSDANMMLEDYKLDSSDIVGEVVEKRDQFEKHFRMEDGTFQAVMYDSAVHYQAEDGSWNEVDNTLEPSEDKHGNSIYKTKDNGYMDASFAGDEKSDKLVSLTKGKHTLSWSISASETKAIEQTASPDITPEPVDTPTPSPEPAASPEPTVAPEPSATPDVSITADPTAEPAVTGTDDASPDSTPTAIAEVSATPESTASPDAASTPEITALPTTPDPTPEPTPEPTPIPTSETVTSATPEATAAPDDGHNTKLTIAPVFVDDASAKKAKLTGNGLKRYAGKATSHIKYSSIMDDVDIDYVIEAQRVKETITLAAYIPDFSISFDIVAEGLTLKELEGGITAFCDGEEEVFYLMPSYAFDGAGSEGAVKTSLESIEGGYRLTLTPDAGWLKNAVYPVAIDPQIDIDWSRSNINDTYISSKYHNGVNNDGTNGDWYSYASLRVGYSDAYYLSHALIKYTALPTLASSEAVIGAYMITEREDDYINNYQFTLHKIIKSWSQTGVTWDNFISGNPNQAYDPTIIETHMVGDAYGTYQSFYTWDITSLMKGWYEDQSTNYGLLIKGVTTTAGYRRFYSANATYVDDAVRTIIQYVNTAGIEAYWSYQSMDARRAGTASVNLFTGNLVVSHSDIGTSGNRMPVSITHVYNAVYKDTDIGYGMGWRLNYSQWLEIASISGAIYYEYIDEDGTINYFKENGSTYEDESGQNRKFELNKLVTDVDNPSGVVYTYALTDKNDNVWCFDYAGRLVKVRDSVGNYISISYSSGYKISSITDGAGRSYTFSYVGGTGELQSISAPGNRTISYGYDTYNRLTTVTYPDNQQTVYYYYLSGIAANALNKLVNYDGHILEVSYNFSTYMKPKVSSTIEWGNTALTVQGESLSFAYTPEQTKVTDQLGNVNCYQFNQYGNAVCIQDDEGRSVYCQYYSPTAIVPGTSTPYGQNKMSLSSRLQEPVMNISKNHNLDSVSNWDSYNGAGGFMGIDTSVKYMGTASIKLYNSVSTSQNQYYQEIPITRGETYTFSCYVKTLDIQGGTGLGVYLSVGMLNSSGTMYWCGSNRLIGTNDWTRLVNTFTVPSDSASSAICIYFLVQGQCGTAWFDCIQLEHQPTANKYNVIENGDMSFSTSGTPDFWTKSSGCTTSDIVTTTTDTNRGLLDSNVFMINGSLNADKSLSQTVMVSGVSGDTFSIGGWARANATPLATKYPNNGGTSYGRQYGIKIELKNGTTDAGSVTIPFNAFSDLWQYASGRVVATGAYDRAIVTLLYENQSNIAYFDGIQLYKEEFGQCYDYDANGNLITAKDLASGTSSVQYNSSNEPTSLQPPDCTGNDKYTAAYYTGNKSHLVNTTTTIEGVKSKYDYDAYGNTILAETRDNFDNPSIYIRTKADYTANGNYIYRFYDPRGYYNEYSYDSNFGVNDSTTDPSGQVVNYTYDKTTSKLGRLTSVSSTTNGTTYTNSYGYTNDLLTSITHNGFNYTIGYNTFGQATSVNAAGQNLVTNTYITSDRSYLLDYLTYGNSGKVDYSYDSRYRVSAVTYDNEATPRYTYAYGANGHLGVVTDNQNGLTTRLYYDLADRPMKTVEQYSGLTRTFQYTYDIDSCLTQFLELFGSTTYDIDMTYDRDNRITKVNYNNQAAGSENVRYTYDVLGRSGTRTLETGTNDYAITYSYLFSGYSPSGATTGMVSSINYSGSSSLSYTYDNCGRVLSVNDGIYTTYYTYDGLGQLIRIDDQTDRRAGPTGTTWTYFYDAGGNISSRHFYGYCYGDNDLTDNAVLNAYYIYDSVWKDKLTSVGGDTITYDNIGNPLSYNGWTYTWEAGRQLKQMSNGTATLQFKYNDAGLRTQKINGTTTTKYYWSGNRVSHMTTGSDTLHFWYDAAGMATMVTYNGTNYYYLHNLQGDIIGLINASGTQVVSYTYDSWGKQLSCTGSLANTLGTANPLRYRGYIYDEETGLYYLQSRYYNPEWGRFVNSDGLLNSNTAFLGTNLFIYCLNNPINKADHSGYDSDLEDLSKDIGKVPIGRVDITGGGQGKGCTSIQEYLALTRNSQSSKYFDEIVRNWNSKIPQTSNAVVQVRSSGAYKIVSTEVKAPTAMKPQNVTSRWNEFLGESTTNYNKWKGTIDNDRIFSLDGAKSIRFGNHEIKSMGTQNFHYHEENWVYDSWENILFYFNVQQRIVK